MVATLVYRTAQTIPHGRVLDRKDLWVDSKIAEFFSLWSFPEHVNLILDQLSRDLPPEQVKPFRRWTQIHGTIIETVIREACALVFTFYRHSGEWRLDQLDGDTVRLYWSPDGSSDLSDDLPIELELRPEDLLSAFRAYFELVRQPGPRVMDEGDKQAIASLLASLSEVIAVASRELASYDTVSHPA